MTEVGQSGPDGASAPLHVMVARRKEAGHVLTPLVLDQVVIVQDLVVIQEHVILVFAKVRIIYLLNLGTYFSLRKARQI